ncbi:glycosyltransferase family 8 protein [Entomospira culicis]|uniref:Glycosyltransferase family 8 protein n=1 Tax=Entomospira culicis TaxID=2719989 RepID=A0A968GG05_9SPIO|nr:glycosyltransferase family 8 protein [Entomospira culicis]NIZ19667.1 glycosyltransferase family 8 protein [Entomospira culicis]NIZ69881.1 glycosyltransferase family 8 protein [Entomospira culicis]WDI36986.1 glycosyltransferase family 8 protein [Entomospira culicis]WDI38615.1 glycosyltransferase family 8 protein [Entomospira culicis]
MRMPIAYAINDGYTKPLMAQLVALYEHAKKETIYDLYILNYQLKEENRKLITNLVGELKTEAKVTFLDITDAEYKQIPLLGQWPKETDFRGFLPRLLPDIDVLLYLDADTLVIEDLAHLMNIDLDGYYYAGCRDIFDHNKQILNLACVESNHKVVDLVLNYNYINAGVLLMNLAYLRQNNFSQDFLQVLKKGVDAQVLGCPDQDVINYLAIKDGVNRIYYLPANYNSLYLFGAHHKEQRITFDAESATCDDLKFHAGIARRNQLVRDPSLIRDKIIIFHLSGLSPWRSTRPRDEFVPMFKPYADRVGLEIPPLKKRYQNTNFHIIKNSLRGKNIYKLHRKIKVALLFALGVGFVLGLISTISIGT